MSRLKYKVFECAKCGCLLDPLDLANGFQFAYEVKNKRLKKTRQAIAHCQDGHPGVFPAYKNLSTYISHIKGGVLFHLKSSRWVEKYLEDPDNYGQGENRRCRELKA
jgi:hypothetical protein